MRMRLVDLDGDPVEHYFETLLTTKETARILAVNSRTLYNWASAGKLRFIMSAGGHRRYPLSAVQAAARGEWDKAGDSYDPRVEEDANIAVDRRYLPPAVEQARIQRKKEVPSEA